MRRRAPAAIMEISVLDSLVSVPDALQNEPDRRSSRPLQGAARDRIFRYLLARVANNGGLFVDLGANFGLLAKIARDEGYAVTAVDARAERKPPQEELGSIRWVQTDVREFEMSGFEIIACPGLLYHFDLDDQMRILERCARADVPVILDTQVHVDRLVPAAQTGDWARKLVARGPYEGVVDPEGDPSMAWIGNRESFWPTEESILRMFADAGFRKAAIVDPLFTSKFGGRRFFLLNCEKPAEETPAETAKRDRSCINNLVNEGRFDEAREIFERLPPASAGAADWTYLRAVLQMQIHFGEREEAVATMVKLRDRALDFGEAYSLEVLRRARYFDAAGNLAEAEKTREQVFERLSKPTIVMYLTQVLIKTEEWDDARRFLAQIERRFADNLDLLVFAAQSYQQMGDFGAAERVWRAAIAREPENAPMLGNFGSFLSSQDKHEEAASAFERALALDPYDTKILERLISVYLKLKRFEDAERHARTTLCDSPDNPRIHYYLASALRNTKRRREALDHARRAAELDPTNDRYHKYADDLAMLVAKTAGEVPSSGAEVP